MYYLSRDQNLEYGIVWPTKSCKKCCPYTVWNRMGPHYITGNASADEDYCKATKKNNITAVMSL